MAHHYKKLGFLLTSSAFTSAVMASGFAIQEQSVTGLGRAFAGSAAVADDATTVFYNPAGLTQLSRPQIAAGLHLILPLSDYRDTGSTTAAAIGGAPLSGNDGIDAGETAVVPNFYYAHQFNDRFYGGIGITAPFGLATDYKDDWQGRYHALRSELKTININPSFAYKASERLSVGIGISAQYIDLELSQAVDIGSACAAALIGACAAPQSNDGKAKLKADDWAFGYNLGLTYQVNEATRLGLAYRSKISHTLEGDGEFRLPDNAQALAGAFTKGDIYGDVDLPETLSFAIHHQIRPDITIMADATWTRWSRFKELAINSDDVARLNSTKPENWENTMRYAIGLDYQYNAKWTFRAGVAYDESPVKDEFRTARIPDKDRTWLAVGTSYKMSESLFLDAGYTHIFVDDPDVDETLELPLDHRLVGEYDASVDIVSVQARWLF